MVLGVPYIVCAWCARAWLALWYEHLFGYLLYGGYYWGCFGVTDFTLFGVAIVARLEYIGICKGKPLTRGIVPRGTYRKNGTT